MKQCNHIPHTISGKYFNSDIIITDPCYIIPAERPQDWICCDYGEDMFSLGFRHCLCRRTPDGDWFCEVFRGTGRNIWTSLDPAKKIGTFSADTGKVGVFYLQEILRYNPAFDDHIKKPWCACWIKNFAGTVRIISQTDPHGDESMHVIGCGNQTFFSRESYWSKAFPMKKEEKI